MGIQFCCTLYTYFCTFANPMCSRLVFILVMNRSYSLTAMDRPGLVCRTASLWTGLYSPGPPVVKRSGPHHTTIQFTPNMKANAEPLLISSLVGIDFGVVVSQHHLESLFTK